MSSQNDDPVQGRLAKIQRELAARPEVSDSRRAEDQARIAALEGEVERLRVELRQQRALVESKAASAHKHSGGDDDSDTESHRKNSTHPPKSLKAKGGCLVFSLIGFLMTVGFVGGIGYLVYTMAWSRVEGVWSMEIDARTQGADPTKVPSWTSAPTECRSGESFTPEFLGAVLTDEAGHELKIFGPDSADGHAMLKVAPGQPDYVFDATTCERFELFVEWSGAEVNDVSAVKGVFRVRCDLRKAKTATKTAPGTITITDAPKNLPSTQPAAFFTADLTFSACH